MLGLRSNFYVFVLYPPWNYPQVRIWKWMVAPFAMPPFSGANWLFVLGSVTSCDAHFLNQPMSEQKKDGKPETGFRWLSGSWKYGSETFWVDIFFSETCGWSPNFQPTKSCLKSVPSHKTFQWKGKLQVARWAGTKTWKNLGYLLYIGDEILPSYIGIIIKKPIEGSLITNQYFNEK